MIKIWKTQATYVPSVHYCYLQCLNLPANLSMGAQQPSYNCTNTVSYTFRQAAIEPVLAQNASNFCDLSTTYQAPRLVGLHASEPSIHPKIAHVLAVIYIAVPVPFKTPSTGELGPVGFLGVFSVKGKG